MAEHTHSSLEQALASPGLSPIEFLRAVMEATHQPMSIRIEAAKALLPFTNPYPRSANSIPPRCTFVIPPLPNDHGSVAQDPDTGSTGNHSQNPIGANITLTRDDEALAPQNLTTIPEPSPLIDYSTPPTSDEIQVIKSAINSLRPDLAHLPIPEPRFCECGHWVFGYYPCCSARRPRDGSKLN